MHPRKCLCGWLQKASVDDSCRCGIEFGIEVVAIGYILQWASTEGKEGFEGRQTRPRCFIGSRIES